MWVRTRFWVFCIFGASVALDQASKWLMLNIVMQPPRLIEVTPFFNLTLGFNTGVSFGFLGGAMANHQWLLISLKMAIVLALVVWSLRSRRALECGGSAMLAGGAMGNIIDRWRQGAVTDFLDAHWGDWHWPTFNVADIIIVLGVAMLIVAGLRTPNGSSRNGEVV